MAAGCAGLGCAEEAKAKHVCFQVHGISWQEAFGRPNPRLAGCACITPLVFLGIRTFIAVAWTACVIFSFVEFRDYNLSYWFIYLTHWGALWEFVYFWFAVFTTYMANFSRQAKAPAGHTPWFAVITWVFADAVLVITTVVFLLYWLLVFKPVRPPLAVSVVMHGINWVLALADWLVGRRPFYLVHVYVPLLWAFFYCFFTWVYHVAGGMKEDGSPYIYSVLDWNNASKVLVLLVIVVFAVVPVLYCCYFWTSVASRRCLPMRTASCEGEERPTASAVEADEAGTAPEPDEAADGEREKAAVHEDDDIVLMEVPSDR